MASPVEEIMATKDPALAKRMGRQLVDHVMTEQGRDRVRATQEYPGTENDTVKRDAEYDSLRERMKAGEHHG